MMIKGSKVLVTGGEGFLGSYVVEALRAKNPKEIFVPKHEDYDLRELGSCRKVVEEVDLVIHLAAQIGGIGYIDSIPGEIFYNNAVMGINLMEAARAAGVKKFVSVGTVCEYPKDTPIPFKEENLWDGYPEETTAPYGWAKKILIVQSKAYRKQYGFNSIHILPVNLYGPRDNFDRKLSHVIPALIKRFVEAKRKNESKVYVWGTGKATREFLYVTDAADGILRLSENYDSSDPVNLGTGIETSITEVSEMIASLVGFTGEIVFDSTKPNGQPRRRLDISRARKIGYSPKVGLKEGLKATIEWYLKSL